MTDAEKRGILTQCFFGPNFMHSYAIRRGGPPPHIKQKEGFVPNDQYEVFLNSYYSPGTYQNRLWAAIGKTASGVRKKFIASPLKQLLAHTPDAYEEIGRELVPLLLGGDANERRDILKFCKALRNEGAIKVVDFTPDVEFFSFSLKSDILKCFFQLCADGDNQLPTDDELWDKIPPNPAASYRAKFTQALKDMGLALPKANSAIG